MKAEGGSVPRPSGGATVALTGAGISAESGVPTFRGAGGLWREHRPEELATPRAFARDPKLVWDFYRWRRSVVAQAVPNDAHKVLVEVEQSCSPFLLITQNIDGLHAQAGSSAMIELHGSLWRERCTECEHVWRGDTSSLPAELPTCPHCGALGRPDVVWFGEALDPHKLDLAFAWASSAELFLVVGTSAIVYPAAQIPLEAARAGARLIEFNLERTALSAQADEVILGRASETLPAWWRDQRRS